MAQPFLGFVRVLESGAGASALTGYRLNVKNIDI